MNLEHFSSVVAELDNKIHTHTHNDAELLDKILKTTREQGFENTVEKEVEDPFVHAIGIYKPKTIGSDSTVDIIEDNENV